MSRFRRQQSYSHRVQYICPDGYRLHWTIDRYYEGSRLRHPTGYSRDTDENGARRFAAKWDCAMPSKLSPAERAMQAIYHGDVDGDGSLA